MRDALLPVLDARSTASEGEVASECFSCSCVVDVLLLRSSALAPLHQINFSKKYAQIVHHMPCSLSMLLHRSPFPFFTFLSRHQTEHLADVESQLSTAKQQLEEVSRWRAGHEFLPCTPCRIRSSQPSAIESNGQQSRRKLLHSVDCIIVAA